MKKIITAALSFAALCSGAIAAASIEPFDSSSGELAPVMAKEALSGKDIVVSVPPLAVDETSIGIVWTKGADYGKADDYAVYINGERRKETARQNYARVCDWADVYTKAFYSYYTKQLTGIDMVRTSVCSFRADGLESGTEYRISVAALDKNGRETGVRSAEITCCTQKASAADAVINVTQYGAVSIASVQESVKLTREATAANTKAIQAAIDACPENGTVVIPAGVFVSGSLWLKSNMTFRVDGTLCGSPYAADYTDGFFMYPFFTDVRKWGLLNALGGSQLKIPAADKGDAPAGEPLHNIRICGSGIIDGNGWKYRTAEGRPSIVPQTYAEAGDVDITQPGNQKYALYRFMGSNRVRSLTDGILTADIVADVIRKAGMNPDAGLGSPDAPTDKVLAAGYAARATMIILKNVDGVYVGDVTLTNPSNHTLNISNSSNVSVTNTRILTYDCNNADAIDFTCSSSIYCWNNFIDSGDDAVNFAASVGKTAAVYGYKPVVHVWIAGNYIHEGHGGAVCAGSHTASGITDIVVEDNVMNHTDMPFRFKSAPANGGYVSNVVMRDCAAADCDQAFVLSTAYSDPGTISTYIPSDIPAEFHHLTAKNITVYNVVNNTICIFADVDPVNAPQKPWHTHHDLTFSDITFAGVGRAGTWQSHGGWETLTGCRNSVFNNVRTVSYADAAVAKKTDKAWTNIAFSSGLQFTGTTPRIKYQQYKK